MKKFLMLAVTALFAVTVFTGCGKKETAKEVSVDVNKLCSDLKGTINATVADVPADSIASTFFIDLAKVEESAAALNSGADVCEVVVLKCSDSSYTSEAEDLFKNRIKLQSDLFADYDAPSVAKLDSAILKSSGNYVVYCVTDDNETAEKIIKEAGF